MAELARLCREGRTYAVEEWIRSGAPLYATTGVTRGRRPASALRLAVESRQYDLALLLLANGFPADPPHERLLAYALNEKALPYVDLLLTWGADPLQVDPSDVLQTYESVLYDRFTTFGVDLTGEHALALELARSSSNRPAYGWAKRRVTDPAIARELAIALCDAIEHEKDRAVALLLWASADAHLKVPSLRYSRADEPEDAESNESAVEVAIRGGKGRYLPQLKPDPAGDNLQLLWRSVHDIGTLDHLVRIAPPHDWSPTLVCTIHRMTWGFGTAYQERAALERMFTVYGAKLTTLDGDRLGSLRRSILSVKNDYELLPVLRFLSKPEFCDPSIFAELMRTGAMRARFGGRGLKGVPAPPPSRVRLQR